MSRKKYKYAKNDKKTGQKCLKKFKLSQKF